MIEAGGRLGDFMLAPTTFRSLPSDLLAGIAHVRYSNLARFRLDVSDQAHRAGSRRTAASWDVPIWASMTRGQHDQRQTC
jgi:hypothetical protein